MRFQQLIGKSLRGGAQAAHHPFGDSLLVSAKYTLTTT